jgi:GT2 family glycosyltransferase
MVDVALIIVSWNVRDYLVKCLRSVYSELNRSGLKGTVWVVDNASTDGTVDYISNLFPQLNLIMNDHNPGFGAANNQGLKAAAADEPRNYFLLNPDTVLQTGSLKEMVRSLDTLPEAGMVGARLVYGDGRFQHSAFYFPGVTQLMFDLFPMPARLYESRLNGRYARSHYQRNGKPFAIDHPLGATIMVKAEVVEATKGFDESYHLYCEEIDWSWRVRSAGWKIYTVPMAEIVHYGGESTRQIPAKSVVNLWRSRAQLYQQHHGRLKLMMSRWLVAKGMRRKAAKANSPDMKQAYEEIIRIWQKKDEPIDGQEAPSVQVAGSK